MIDLYNFEPSLFARCLLDVTSIKTLNNVLAVGSTSKTCYLIINSNPFFSGLVYEVDPNHPYFSSKQEKKEGLLKHRFRELRSFFSCKKEIQLNSCTLPTLDQSNAYLAITEGSKVNVYTSDKKEHLASYEIEGEICQATIHDHYLSVIERDTANVCFLVTYDFTQLQDYRFSIVLPGEYTTPVCFGKDYFMYVDSSTRDIAYAIPLFSEGVWVQDVETEGFLYYFSSGDHFIEVLFEGDTLSISKVCIEKDLFIKTPIIKDFGIPHISGSSIGDVHFHNSRLFFSLEAPTLDTKLFSYDIELERLKELTTVPACDDEALIFHCFLSAAEKVYYLSMKLESDEITSQLTLLKFGKI